MQRRVQQRLFAHVVSEALYTDFELFKELLLGAPFTVKWIYNCLLPTGAGYDQLEGI